MDVYHDPARNRFVFESGELRTLANLEDFIGSVQENYDVAVQGFRFRSGRWVAQVYDGHGLSKFVGSHSFGTSATWIHRGWKLGNSVLEAATNGGHITEGVESGDGEIDPTLSDEAAWFKLRGYVDY